MISTGGVHLLSCNVSFRGNWAPVMEWRMVNMTESINGKNVYHKTTPNDSVISVLTLNSSLTAHRYTCTTRFIPDMRPPTTNATNVPNYTHIWTSPDILLHGTCKSIKFCCCAPLFTELNEITRWYTADAVWNLHPSGQPTKTVIPNLKWVCVE